MAIRFYDKVRSCPTPRELKQMFSLLWKVIEYLEGNVAVSFKVDSDISRLKALYYELRDELGV